MEYREGRKIIYILGERNKVEEKRNRGGKGKIEDIDFSPEEASSRRGEPLDPNYNRPGDDFGPSRFIPQTGEFTLVDDDYYGFFMWRGGNGVLYLS